MIIFDKLREPFYIHVDNVIVHIWEENDKLFFVWKKGRKYIWKYFQSMDDNDSIYEPTKDNKRKVLYSFFWCWSVFLRSVFFE